MALDPGRTPVRPLRGTRQQIEQHLQQLPKGELVWLTDEYRAYVIEVDGLGVRSLRIATGAVASVSGLAPIQVSDPQGWPVVSISPASAGGPGSMSAAHYTKLEGIAENANNYTLPVATDLVLGGVKVDNTSITVDPDGTLHAVGVGGGGSVTLVSGVAPVSVTNGTTTPQISVADASTSVKGVVRLASAQDITDGTSGRVVDAAQLKDAVGVPVTRQVIAGSGLSGGGALSGNVTLSIDVATQGEAEAGLLNTKVMTPLRTAQAMATAVRSTRQVLAGVGLAGGGALSGDVTLAASLASQVQAQLGDDNGVLMTPLRATQHFTHRLIDSLDSVDTTKALTAAQGKVLADSRVPTSRQVVAGTGLSGGGSLTGNVTLNVRFASQAEAIAGIASDRVMSPLRVQEALSAVVPGTRQITAGTGLTGGGDLTSNRSFALTGQALALHNFTGVGLMVRTGAAAISSRQVTAGAGIAVANGSGVNGDIEVAAAIADQAQAEAGSANNVLMTPLRVAQLLAAIGGTSQVDVDVYTTNGTFTKDARDILYLVEVAGGGGSGAKSGNSGVAAGGGGGGGYAWRILAASEVTTPTVAVVVGEGGPSVSDVGGADGNDGEASAFGNYIGVYGGKGGLTSGFGGKGGGVYDPDSVTVSAATQGGYIGADSGYDSVYGGGGGNGGRSIAGGGGGGRSIAPYSTGGVSALAGDGGSGSGATSAGAGVAPGGGGGGTGSGSLSGAGARGEVRVYRLRS